MANSVTNFQAISPKPLKIEPPNFHCVKRGMRTAPRQQHFDVHLGNVLEHLHIDILDVDFRSQALVLAHFQQQHKPAEDRHLDLFQIPRLIPAPQITLADIVAANKNFNAIEDAEIHFHVQAPFAGTFQRLVNVLPRQAVIWRVPLTDELLEQFVLAFLLDLRHQLGQRCRHAIRVERRIVILEITSRS